MKTRLEYQLRKFKKRYRFKQIGNDPNYGTILIDGYVFRVRFEMKSIIGQWLNYEPNILSILLPDNEIIVPKSEILRSQRKLRAGLYHEIGHFILYEVENCFYTLDLETLCDLMAYIYCGFKDAKSITHYERNHRYNYMIAILVPDAGMLINMNNFTKDDKLKLSYAKNHVRRSNKYYREQRLYIDFNEYRTVLRISFNRTWNLSARTSKLIEYIKNPGVINPIKEVEKKVIGIKCERHKASLYKSTHVRDYTRFNTESCIYKHLYPYVYK